MTLPVVLSVIREKSSLKLEASATNSLELISDVTEESS